MDKLFYNRLTKELGIKQSDLDKAQQQARAQNTTFLQALLALSVGDALRILEVYSQCYNIQTVSLADKDIAPDIINLIPREVAEKDGVVPIDRVGNHIILAMENPADLNQLDQIKFKTGYHIKGVVAARADIQAAIDQYYRAHPRMEEFSNVSSESSFQKTVQQRAVISSGKTISDKDGAIVQLVDKILVSCLMRKASDIHVEPYETYLRVRLRIDGELSELTRTALDVAGAVTNRIKILANIDVAEKRKPQDGAIQVVIDHKPIDFRVNTLPTVYGEKIVLRLLDKTALKVDLTKLGFEADDYKRFRESIYKPYGIVLVTGPTGSGKTTTLYSALSELNKLTENIITAEDPVEYKLDGINQVQVHADIGFDFAAALRSFLRQDPDVIMVGEIRDRETGEIAVKASLTGHLVLSTLHTNNAADTVIRLQNMGVESFNLVAALNCIVAQRLMRKICEKCRVADESVKKEHLVQIGIPAQLVDQVKPMKGKGCPSCNQSGYRGRSAVHEVMVLNEPLRDAIMKNKSSGELKRIAMAGGMRSLRQNALYKMMRGEVDLMEVIKNTASDSDASEGVRIDLAS